MGNTTEYEEITKFEITALVFFRLGRNNSLNNSEYAVVNEYLSNLKSISSTDVEIFNAVSDKSFFIKRYEHKNMGVFLNLSEIMFSIKTELYKQNIMIHEEQLRQLKTDSVYLLIKMFKLKKYYAPQSNDKNHNAKKSENIPITIHVYKSNKNDIECFTNHHSVTSKQFRCPNEYSNRTFNFWYCEECGKYLIRNKTYENNVKYFEGLNIT